VPLHFRVIPTVIGVNDAIVEDAAEFAARCTMENCIGVKVITYDLDLTYRMFQNDLLEHGASGSASARTSGNRSPGNLGGCRCSVQSFDYDLVAARLRLRSYSKQSFMRAMIDCFNWESYGAVGPHLPLR